jgi:hypothetical protein
MERGKSVDTEIRRQGKERKHRNKETRKDAKEEMRNGGKEESERERTGTREAGMLTLLVYNTRD